VSTFAVTCDTGILPWLSFCSEPRLAPDDSDPNFDIRLKGAKMPSQHINHTTNMDKHPT